MFVFLFSSWTQPFSSLFSFWTQPWWTQPFTWQYSCCIWLSPRYFPYFPPKNCPSSKTACWKQATIPTRNKYLMAGINRICHKVVKTASASHWHQRDNINLSRHPTTRKLSVLRFPTRQRANWGPIVDSRWFYAFKMFSSLIINIHHDAYMILLYSQSQNTQIWFPKKGC